MSAASPIAPELFASLRTGDEKALEQIFRSRYSGLEEEARRKLTEPESAPRVVERAFAKMWGDRERIDSPEAFEEYLHSALHEAAGRELKRNAMAKRLASQSGGDAKAHKHDTVKPPANMEEAWTHLSNALHAPKEDQATKDQANRLAQHSAASKIGHIADTKFPTEIVVIGGVALAIALGAMFYLNRTTADRGVVAALESNDAVEQKSEMAQRGNLNLDDGTVVTIGPQTRIRVAKGFNTLNRAVKLEGTASFNVTKKVAEMPFRVRAQKYFFDATGTKFDVRNYPQEGKMFLRVREGSVSVLLGKEPTVIAAGNSIVIDSAGASRKPSDAELDEALGWSDGHVSLNDRTLRDALPEIERWYGVHIGAPDPKHLDAKVTMTAPLDSVRLMISALEKSTQLKFGYAGANMIVYDPKNPPKGVR